MPSSKNKSKHAQSANAGTEDASKSDQGDFAATLAQVCRSAGRELQGAYMQAFGSRGLFPTEDSLCSSVIGNANSKQFRARGKRKPHSFHDTHAATERAFAERLNQERLNEAQHEKALQDLRDLPSPRIEELETRGDPSRVLARNLRLADEHEKSNLLGKTVKIVDSACICLDATASDEIVWPSEEMKDRGSVDTWPLWGWMESLDNRKAKIIEVWQDKRNGCQASGTSLYLLEIDEFYLPILAKGVEVVETPSAAWDEEEMSACITSWLRLALAQHDVPIEALARRTHMTVVDIRKWLDAPAVYSHTPDDPSGPTITEKLHGFLLRTSSCEVCLGKICSCCHIFCTVCEKLHCRGCADQCVRCDDCLKCFELGQADTCAECEDNFCRCQRDRLYCDGCGDTLCSECAVILPCFNCGKGHCLLTKKFDLRGCCNEENLWMCPDCRCVGYCRGPPHPSTQGQWCMEYGSIVCHACGHRVCLDCAMESPTSFAGHAACTRCGNRRSGRSAQLLKLKLRRRSETCRSGKCSRCQEKLGEQNSAGLGAGGGGGAGGEGNGQKLLEGGGAAAGGVRGRVDESALADSAMLELIQEEEGEKERQKEGAKGGKAKDAQEVLAAPAEVRIAAMGVTGRVGAGKKKEAQWGVTVEWERAAGEAKRGQVRLDGVELRVSKLEEEGRLLLTDVKLEGSAKAEHVLLLRIARARGPWSAWSGEVRFVAEEVPAKREESKEGKDGGALLPPSEPRGAAGREEEKDAPVEGLQQGGKGGKKCKKGGQGPEKVQANGGNGAHKQQNGNAGKGGRNGTVEDGSSEEDDGEDAAKVEDAEEAAEQEEEEEEVEDWEAAASQSEAEKTDSKQSADEDEDEDEEDDEESEDEDALLRLAALSNAKRPAAPSSPHRKGSAKAALSREQSGEAGLGARSGSGLSLKTKSVAANGHWPGMANGVDSPSRHGQAGQQLGDERQRARAGQAGYVTSSGGVQKTVTWENGNMVVCCPLNTKEKGSVIGERGARVKELKKRWPRVFVYVERDNRVTVRGAVAEEVEACTELVLFFKDKDKDWDPATWCACGTCKTVRGCATKRNPPRPAPLAPQSGQPQPQPQRSPPGMPHGGQGYSQASPAFGAGAGMEGGSSSWGDSWGAGGSSFGSPLDTPVVVRPPPPLPNNSEVEDWELEDNCAICFERDADVRLLPCNHSLCNACADQCRHRTIFLAQQGVTCPFCRTVVESTSRITAPSRSLPRPAAWQRPADVADTDPAPPRAGGTVGAMDGSGGVYVGGLGMAAPGLVGGGAGGAQRALHEPALMNARVGGAPGPDLNGLSLLRLEEERGGWHGHGSSMLGGGGGGGWGEHTGRDGGSELDGWGESLMLGRGEAPPMPSWNPMQQQGAPLQTDGWDGGVGGAGGNHRVAMLLQRQQQQLQMQDSMIEVQGAGREEDASMLRMMFGVNLS